MHNKGIFRQDGSRSGDAVQKSSKKRRKGGSLKGLGLRSPGKSESKENSKMKHLVHMDDVLPALGEISKGSFVSLSSREVTVGRNKRVQKDSLDNSKKAKKAKREDSFDNLASEKEFGSEVFSKGKDGLFHNWSSMFASASLKDQDAFYEMTQGSLNIFDDSQKDERDEVFQLMEDEGISDVSELLGSNQRVSDCFALRRKGEKLEVSDNLFKKFVSQQDLDAILNFKYDRGESLMEVMSRASFKSNYGWLSDGFKVKVDYLDKLKDAVNKTLEICFKTIHQCENKEKAYLEEVSIRAKTILDAIQNVVYHPSSVRMQKDSSKSGAFHAVYFGKINKGAGQSCVFKPVRFKEYFSYFVMKHQQIEEDNSHLIGRNMVVGELASKMGVGEFIVKTRPTFIDAEDGLLKLGLAMDEAQGLEADGMLSVAKTGRPLMEDGNFRKAITQMDWLDRLCWQIDRHGGNFFIKIDEGGKFVGLKGIDNDICLGAKKDPLDGRSGEALSELGYWSAFSLPHVIDVDTAECLLSLKDRDMDEVCHGRLNSLECEALKFRLGKIQKHIERLKSDGRVIANTKEAWGDPTVKKWLSEPPELPEGYAPLYGKGVKFTGLFSKIQAKFGENWT